MDWFNIYYGISSAGRTLRAVLTALGLMLLLFGLLILLVPWLLQLIVGSAFIVMGVTILGFAWRRRRPPHEQGDEPDVVDEWR